MFLCVWLYEYNNKYIVVCSYSYFVATFHLVTLLK